MFGKRTATLLILLSLFSSTFYLPVFTPKAQAQFAVVDIKALVRQLVDGFAMNLAQRMIDEIVKSTVRWANNGFDDNPAYVVDPGRFFTNIADNVAGEFIDGSELGFLCSPFKTKVILSLQRYYTGPDKRFECTLTDVVDNIDAFYDDFNQGGWDAWFSMTQNDNNNPYGAYLQAQIELDSRVAKAVGFQREQLNLNSGFLSYSDCIREDPDTEECLERDPVIKTPGIIIKTQLDQVLPSGLSKLITVNHVEQLIGAFASGLLKRFVFSDQGLFTENYDDYLTNTSNTPPVVSVLDDCELARTLPGGEVLDINCNITSIPPPLITLPDESFPEPDQSCAALDSGLARQFNFTTYDGGVTDISNKTFRDAFGPWPGLGDYVEIFILPNHYISLPFRAEDLVAPFTTLLSIKYLDSPKGAFTTLTISECPGDFNKETLVDPVCFTDDGIAGGGIIAEIGPSTNRCSLNQGGVYYLNIAHAFFATSDGTNALNQCRFSPSCTLLIGTQSIGFVPLSQEPPPDFENQPDLNTPNPDFSLPPEINLQSPILTHYLSDPISTMTVTAYDIWSPPSAASPYILTGKVAFLTIPANTFLAIPFKTTPEDFLFTAKRIGGPQGYGASITVSKYPGDFNDDLFISNCGDASGNTESAGVTMTSKTDPSLPNLVNFCQVEPNEWYFLNVINAVPPDFTQTLCAESDGVCVIQMLFDGTYIG